MRCNGPNPTKINRLSIQKKKNKNEGDNIRAAALNDMSDSDDHGDHGSSVHEMSRARSASTSFFDSGHLTLQEEESMDQELMREYDESQSLQNQPSTSRVHELPNPNESLALQEDVIVDVDEDEQDEEDIRNREVNREAQADETQTDEDNRQLVRDRNDNRQLVPVREPEDNRQLVRDRNDNRQLVPVREPEDNRQVVQFDISAMPSGSNNRFSNPKKDLINYLERKSLNETGIRREEVRIREMEAENRREELKIQRLKVKAEAEERKKIQDLLIQLVTKNQN